MKGGADLPLRTTVIGAFPKPDYLELADWFRVGHANVDPREMGKDFEQAEADPNLQRAIEECIACQCRHGIDIITDGEMGRENYVHHFCRQIEGISFSEVKRGQSRGRSLPALLQIIIGPLSGPMYDDSKCTRMRRRARMHAPGTKGSDV